MLHHGWLCHPGGSQRANVEPQEIEDVIMGCAMPQGTLPQISGDLQPLPVAYPLLPAG